MGRKLRKLIVGDDAANGLAERMTGEGGRTTFEPRVGAGGPQPFLSRYSSICFGRLYITVIRNPRNSTTSFASFLSVPLESG